MKARINLKKAARNLKTTECKWGLVCDGSWHRMAREGNGIRNAHRRLVPTFLCTFCVRCCSGRLTVTGSTEEHLDVARCGTHPSLTYHVLIPSESLLRSAQETSVTVVRFTCTFTFPSWSLGGGHQSTRPLSTGTFSGTTTSRIYVSSIPHPLVRAGGLVA